MVSRSTKTRIQKIEEALAKITDPDVPKRINETLHKALSDPDLFFDDEAIEAVTFDELLRRRPDYAKVVARNNAYARNAFDLMGDFEAIARIDKNLAIAGIIDRDDIKKIIYGDPNKKRAFDLRLAKYKAENGIIDSQDELDQTESDQPGVWIQS